MKRYDSYVRAPGGRLAPLRRVSGAVELGQALEPGVVVETDLRTALDCGAVHDDTVAADDAFEAAEDPSDFWGG